MQLTQCSRRRFLNSTVGGLAGLSFLNRLPHALGQSLAPAASGNIIATRDIRSTPLADNLFLLTGAGANVIAKVGAEGILLVDGGLADHAPKLAQAVAALPGAKPVKILFNTHWHPEQTGSNVSLAQSGVTIVAHARTRLWLTRNVTRPDETVTYKRLPPEALPKKTFYDTDAIDFDGGKIQCGYMLQAHTDGDAYVYFPKENVLALGGVTSANAWPYVDWWTGGWIDGISSGLRVALGVANADTKIVPADGPVMTKAALEAQQKMYATIAQDLRKSMYGGHTTEEAVNSGFTKEYDAQMGDPKAFVKQAFESMWAHFTPDG